MSKKDEKGKKVKKSADEEVKKTRAPRKNSRIAFLREMYEDDPEISNESALRKLLAAFPESNANVKSIVTWKNMLRAEGIDIPKQKAGRPSSEWKAETKKVKKGKKK